MKIYIDKNGTTVDNIAGHELAAILEAVHDMARAGHQIEPCSASPLNGDYDKTELLSRADLQDVVLIDDDRHILAVALRKGAIAVPAERLLEFADAIAPKRSYWASPGHEGEEG